jgi:hypothetical protein
VDSEGTGSRATQYAGGGRRSHRQHQHFLPASRQKSAAQGADLKVGATRSTHADLTAVALAKTEGSALLPPEGGSHAAPVLDDERADLTD